MVPADSIRTTVSAYFTTLSAMDVDAWLALFEPDATAHDPGPTVLAGHEQLRGYVDALLTAFSAFSLVHDEIFACDAGAAVRWQARATTKSGDELAFSGIETFEIGATGKIRQARAYWDPAQLHARLQELASR